MTRTAQTVKRFGKRISGPFGGYSAHNDPSQVGPLNALRAENVILKHGRIKRRLGFVSIRTGDGKWNHPGSSPGDPQIIQPGKCVGIHSWNASITRPTPAANLKTATFMACKILKHPTFGEAQLWIRDDRQKWWQRDKSSVLHDQVRDIDSIDRPHFVRFNQTRRKFDNLHFSGYDSTVLMLDGSTRVWKLTGFNAQALPVGLIAPRFEDIELVSDGGDELPANTKWSFKVSVCNRSVTPEDQLILNPGVESNASDRFRNPGTSDIEVGADGSSKAALITFQTTSPDIEQWTHVRLFIRQDTPGAEESSFRFAKYYARHSLFKEAGDGLVNSVENLPFGDVRVVIQLEDQADILAPLPESFAGAFDYAPTRNFPPKKKHYFAEFHGRGYYGNRESSLIEYTDIADIASGGNLEGISGETLPAIDGPNTMLATYFDQLVIGSPTSLMVVTGSQITNTNQTTATGAEVTSVGDVSFETKVVRGPVRNGPGSFVIADNLLYYVSDRGLMRYDGRDAIDVSLAVHEQFVEFERRRLPVAGDVDGQFVFQGLNDQESIFTDSELSHDDNDNIIYMTVSRPVRYSREFGGFPNHDFVRSEIYCYHYRNIDPETGFGHWTKFTTIGPGANFNEFGLPMPERASRYSAITMRNMPNGPPRLVIATIYRGKFVGVFEQNTLAEDQSTEDEGFSYTHRFEDEVSDGEYVGLDAIWQSGHHDYGLIERRKRFDFLSVHITPNTEFNEASRSALLLGWTVDKQTHHFVSRGLAHSHTKARIGEFGDTISVSFDLKNSRNDFELLSYAVDLQPVDTY